MDPPELLLVPLRRLLDQHHQRHLVATQPGTVNFAVTIRPTIARSPNRAGSQRTPPAKYACRKSCKCSLSGCIMQPMALQRTAPAHHVGSARPAISGYPPPGASAEGGAYRRASQANPHAGGWVALPPSAAGTGVADRTTGAERGDRTLQRLPVAATALAAIDLDGTLQSPSIGRGTSLRRAVTARPSRRPGLLQAPVAPGRRADGQPAISRTVTPSVLACGATLGRI